MKTEQNFLTKEAAPKDIQRPRLALPLGDPAGIGPEIALKALADPSITEKCQITLIGSRSLLQATYRQLRKRVEMLADPEKLSLLNVSLNRATSEQIKVGTPNAASGAASFAYLEAAIVHTLAGEFHGIVTAPIAKSWWKAAGHFYAGQTEVLAHYAGAENSGMLFVGRSPHTGWTLRTLLATTHIPLRQVADALTPQLMTRKLDLLVACLKTDFGISSPRIVISGLNPHSGEQGQLGSEEQDWLIPWLEKERRNRPEVELVGPVPPDTLWVKPAGAWYGNSSTPNPADAYLALYHDQGLIPVKLMAFDQAINTAIGLPFIRTSPDHGTAFDIAGQGVANATSIKAAIQLAAELGSRRLTANSPL